MAKTKRSLWPRRKRLDRLAYEIEGRPVHVTITTQGRKAVLTDGRIPEIVNEVLRSSSDSVEVLVWCLMPDHVHVLVASRGGNVIDWVRVFKGRVASEARQVGLHALWQRSFHDHVLRTDVETAKVVRYLLENPVRAGMAERWKDWPHHGSLTFDLSAWTDL